MSSAMHSHDARAAQQHRLGLIGLAMGLLGTGAGLYAIGGPPHLPRTFLGWTEVLVTLRGPELPLDGLAYAFTTAAWLLWLWMVGSIVLHTFVVIAEGFSSGSWVHLLRRVSDRVTAPLVRRLVEGALVALFVAQIAGRAGTAAAAQPYLPVSGAVAPMVAQSQTVHRFVGEQPADQSPVQYTVQSGDTLWAISQRFYGAGKSSHGWSRRTQTEKCQMAGASRGRVSSIRGGCS